MTPRRIPLVLAPVLLMSGLLIAACDRPAPPPASPPIDPAAIAATVERMQAARDAGQHEAALIYAEEIIQQYPHSPPARQLTGELAELRAAATAQRESKRLAALWTYHAIDAAGGIQYTAYIDGQTKDADAASLRLVLRRHPEWGQNSYLLIGDGADFACTGSCKASLAFDDEPARAFEISRAEDVDPPAVFIEDDRTVFSQVEKSRTLVLDLPLAADRTQRYRFELAGYQPQRMQPAGDDRTD